MVQITVNWLSILYFGLKEVVWKELSSLTDIKVNNLTVDANIYREYDRDFQPRSLRVSIIPRNLTSHQKPSILWLFAFKLRLLTPCE